MPKGTPINPSATSAWVKQLPQEGGAWGQGIIGTIDACQNNVLAYDAQIADLKEKIKQIETAKKAQVKLQRDTAKRAEKEAEALFANSQIARAKEKAEKEASREEKQAAADSEGNSEDQQATA